MATISPFNNQSIGNYKENPDNTIQAAIKALESGNTVIVGFLGDGFGYRYGTSIYSPNEEGIMAFKVEVPAYLEPIAFIGIII